MNASPGRTRFRFGVFEVDPACGDLWKHGVHVRLHDKPFQVLQALLERPGELVTRKELQERLWHGDTFVEFENGLNNAISRLRETLGDSADSPRFIETVPRRGYRFIASVDALADGREEGPVGRPVTAQVPALRRRRLAVLSLAVAAVVMAALTFQSLNRPKVPLNSIAVLPMLYTGPASEPDQEYLADGMTSALTAELSKIKALTVISETSARHYKGTTKPLPQVARELNVEAIVEGSVSREGNLVRVNVQLIRAATDTHEWAEVYQREVGSVLLMQSDLALAIARELRTQVTPEERARIAARRQVHPEAFRLYLLGRYHWNRRTQEGFNKAAELFQQAIDLDPAYAPAYAGLADNYYVQVSWGTLSPQEAFSQAKRAAERALELDNSLAEPYTTLGSILSDYEGDWAGAERAYRRALELNPNDANTHHWYGGFLSLLGRHDEAIEELKRAGELDPLSPMISRSLSTALYMARRFDEAIQQCQRTEQRHPGFPATQHLLGLLYATVGRHNEALSVLDQAPATPEFDTDYGAMGWAYAVAGRKSKAQDMLVQIRNAAGKQRVDFGAVGLIYIGLGQNDHALAWLEKAHQERGSYTNLYLKVDPMFDPLRSNPRFQELLRQMNFPTQAAAVGSGAYKGFQATTAITEPWADAKSGAKSLG